MNDGTPETGPPDESTESLWLATTPTTDYGPLEDGLRVDTVVVGGGIAGLTSAIELKEAGQEVAVIEADRVVSGVTGRTTAKVTSQHGLCYDRLVSEFGREAARQYAEANEAGVDAVAERAAGVDCEFERRPAYVYASSADDLEAIREEVEAARSLGLPASYVEETDLPFDVPGAIRFDDQAQFHPRKYLLSVAESVHGDGSFVFEETRALDVAPGSPCRVETTEGEVVADDVVVASHFPFFDRGGYFARMHPKSAYLLAVRVAEPPPEGMYLSTASPADTLRSHPVDGEQLLLVGGQRHKTGSATSDATERYRNCEAFAREHFTVESVEYRWSTHDYFPVDGVPYVGALGPGADNVHVATGFKGWGMSAGTAAGLILSDIVLEGSSPWADVFDPMRVTPRASAASFLKENAEIGARFVGDRAKAALASDALPARGEATVLRREGDPVGVFRDDEGTVHAVSAVCPHMGCLVAWNDAERTWDCPCHGSRFSHEGDVLSGPSLEGLEGQTLGDR